MNYKKIQLQAMAEQQNISPIYYRDIVGEQNKGEYWIHTHNSSENFIKLIEKINLQYGITDIKVSSVKRLNAVDKTNIQVEIAGVECKGNNRHQVLSYFQELIDRGFGAQLSLDFPTYCIKVTVKIHPTQPPIQPAPHVQTIIISPEDVKDYMDYLAKKNMLKSSLTFKEMAQLDLF